VKTQQDISILRETLMARLDQQGGEMRRAFEQQSELVDETTGQNERLEGIEHKLEAVMMQNQADRKAWMEEQDHTAAQDEQIQSLTKMFYDERTARQSLSEQFSRQQEQLQILRREVECLRIMISLLELQFLFLPLPWFILSRRLPSNTSSRILFLHESLKSQICGMSLARHQTSGTIIPFASRRLRVLVDNSMNRCIKRLVAMALLFPDR
jgi:hypothetical protein